VHGHSRRTQNSQTAPRFARSFIGEGFAFLDLDQDAAHLLQVGLAHLDEDDAARGVVQQTAPRCTPSSATMRVITGGARSSVRAALAKPPSSTSRVHHAITIGTPHQGTWLARWGHTANARQMQVDSPWLRNLAQREGPSDALKLPIRLPLTLPLTSPPISPPISPLTSPLTSRLTCFYSHCDNIVFPPSRATLPGADNRHLPGQAHVQMADAAEPWAELQRRLAD